MSDFLLAEGFGNCADGNHAPGSETEIIGQWVSYSDTFALEDRGDGRKWIKNNGTRQILDIQSLDLGGITTITIAFRASLDALGTGTVVMTLRDGTDWLCWIGINSAGNIGVGTAKGGLSQLPNVGTMLASESIGIGETHFEAKIVLHNSTGAVSIGLNGIDKGTTSALDTINAGTSCDNILLFPNADGGGMEGIPDGWKFGDFVVHTRSSFIGDCGVFFKPGNADGSDADFSPSSGSDHYAMVDEIGPDEDTTYNESDGTSGDRDGVATAGVSGLAVKTVGVLHRVRRTGAGSVSVLQGIIHGGSEDQSAPKAVTAGYSNLVEFFDTNPSTGSAWTAGETQSAVATIEVD